MKWVTTSWAHTQCLFSDKDLGFRIVSLPYEHDGMYFL